MLKKKLIPIFASLSVFFTSATASVVVQPDHYDHPFYIGITGGYGSTTWGSLVPQDPSAAMSIATPIHVSESGAVVGAFAGYEFFPQFAMELSYLHYPNATLFFDEMSLFSFDHDNTTRLVTKTQRLALSAKFMLYIPHSRIRAYSSFGVASVNRKDSVTSRWRTSPIFGVGVNYDLSKRVMLEIGTEYVAGYGQSELDPAIHYIPFLYSIFAQLAYRF